MKSGLLRRLGRATAAVFLLTLIALTQTAQAQDNQQRGRKYKSPPPTARIEVTVTRASSGKPVESAAVVFRSIEGDKGNMEIKTDENGKTVIDVLPIGVTARLQVIATGFQTYGQDFKVDKDNMTIDVKLSRPVEQYSIYKNHDQDSAGKPADATKKPDAQPQSQPQQQ